MLIAIEGIDGAGKTHVSELLAERLISRKVRARFLQKNTAAFGNQFADERLQLLRAAIWPNQPEPEIDLLGAHFYLFLLAAWFSALKRLVSKTLSDDCDVVVMDGSYYRVIAKAHVRTGLSIEHLLWLFQEAVQPDVVALLDIDPAHAWSRRTAHKATELGRWDGFSGSAEDAFCGYQNKIRQLLLDMAREREWTVVHQDATTRDVAVVDRIERLLA